MLIPNYILSQLQTTPMFYTALMLIDDRIHEKEMEVRAEFAAVQEGREQASSSQNSVDVTTKTEEEMALWIKKWQRHFDIMQRQESDLRERLTEYGFNPTSELTRGAEVSDSDDPIDEEDDGDGDDGSNGVMDEEGKLNHHHIETNADSNTAEASGQPNDIVMGRSTDNNQSASKAKSNTSTNTSNSSTGGKAKPKKLNVAKALLRDENMFPEHEQMMNEKEAAFYKMMDAKLKANGGLGMGDVNDGAGRKANTSGNGSSSGSSSSSNGPKQGADCVIPPASPLLATPF